MSLLPVANNVRNSAQPVSNIYQDNSNLTVSSARVLNKEAYRFGFQSLQLGASANTLTIPKNLMVSHVLVQFQFQVPNLAAIPPGRYLSKGFGYSLIRRITMLYGGSEQLEIDGKDNLIRILNECEDDRKKSALYELGGRSVYNNAAGTEITGLDDGFAGDAAGLAAKPGLITAVCAIILPHSSPNSERQIPFDSGILNQPITIRLDLNSAEDIWHSLQYDAEAAPPVITPTQAALSKAEWIVGQQAMIDSSASKADLVGSSGQFQSNYMFYYPAHYQATFSVPTTLIAATGPVVSERINVTLNGFRNGSLQSMVFYVGRLDNFRYRRNADTLGMNNPLFYLQMTDIRLEYGGQIVYTADSTYVAKALDSMINQSDSTFDSELAARDGLNVVKPILSRRSNYYRVQLSQFSEIFRHRIQNGAQMSSDTMQLSFKIIDDNSIIAGGPAETRYNLYSQYVYQASLSVAKGVGSFVFVNPMANPALPQQLSINP